MNTQFQAGADAYRAGYAKDAKSMVKQLREHVQETDKSEDAKKKYAVSGKTVGEPKLSENAQKYYEELKKKYNNMDFVLVSNDMKDRAKAMAGSFARPDKAVVLIDEAKIEQMASDENFRKKYESIIQGAQGQLTNMKNQLTGKGSILSYGMQVEDDGNVSFFAVTEKSYAAQRERIARKAEQKRADHREAKKEAQEAEAKERLEKRREAGSTETVTASSLDELMRKLEDIEYVNMSNQVMTQEELQLGQHIDFRG